MKNNSESLDNVCIHAHTSNLLNSHKNKLFYKGKNEKEYFNTENTNNFNIVESGITLVALVITIIILLIIAGISIQAITNTELFVKAKESKEKSIKSQATETMNLKITTIEISSYIENTKLPTLQYLANKLCEDNDMEYVLKASKKNASLNKIDVGDVTSIYTKLKEYPYEFEINSSLQLASIDGVEVSKNNDSSVKISSDLENWVKTLKENTTISVEDITNSNLLQRLMNNRDSVNYMFSNNNILEAVLNSQSGMECLGKSKYAGYIAITNDNYREKVLNSKYVEYFDKGSTTIPTLSNNDDVIYSSIDSNYKGYYAFDKNSSTSWFSSDTTSAEYIGYNFNHNVIPYKIEIVNIKRSGAYRCKEFYIQGSKDGSSFEDLTSTLIAEQNTDTQKFNITNLKECSIIKMIINNKYTTSNLSNGISEFQVYCREIPNS